MDRLQKILLIALISTSALSWTASRVFQVNMMSAMAGPYSIQSLSLFVAVWTVGMAAMMFPAISPIVLLYNRLVKNSDGKTTLVVKGGKGSHSIKMVLFIGSYLAVWGLTGLALLLGWSLLLNSAGAATGLSPVIYGSILIAAGAYQFSPLKAKCLGYCESPMSFFTRRWRNGTSGAVSMGTYHGLYCLACCWPYFLLMVALGWMDILWMGLFAGIIFGEKIWRRGMWIARAAGIGLAIAGIVTALGVVDISGHSAMTADRGMPAIQESNPAQGTTPVQDLQDQVPDGGMDK
jgi:predicted metal-binding membrane protein